MNDIDIIILLVLFSEIMAEALLEPCKDISHIVKGNPSKYVKLNVGGSLHYTTIGR